MARKTNKSARFVGNTTHKNDTRTNISTAEYQFSREVLQ